MQQTSSLLAVTMVAMLAGCAGAELEKAEMQSPAGSAFTASKSHATGASRFRSRLLRGDLAVAIDPAVRAHFGP